MGSIGAKEALTHAAREIRDEMVCCDIYTVLAGLYSVENMAPYRAMKRSAAYHAMCHYGEMAARHVEELAEELKHGS